MRRRGPSAMDDADLRERTRAIDSDELENLIRVGEAMDRTGEGPGEGRRSGDPCQPTARHRSPTDTSGEGRSTRRESSTDRCADWPYERR